MNEKLQKQKDALAVIREGLMRMIISPRTAKKALRAAGLSNMRISVGGYKDNSKWTLSELRAIRARNGVGRPPGLMRDRLASQIATDQKAYTK